jgi:hypothetical protein
MPGFDPKKYLAEKSGGGFNPSKYLAEKTAMAQPAVEEEEAPSVVESGLRGLAQGATLGHADELTGAGAALLDQLKGDPRTLAEAYRVERNDSRKHYAAAQEENPGVYGVGNVAGGLASGLALTPLTGGASLGGAIGAGALAGALQGEGDSKSDLTEGDVGGVLADTAKGTALGAASGGLGFGAGKLAAAGVAKLAPKVSSALDSAAVASGRRAINGGANTMSTKQPLDARAILRALDDKNIGWFDDAGKISQRMDAARSAAGQKYGNILTSLENEGVRGADAQALASQLDSEATKLGTTDLGSGTPELYRKDADLLRDSSKLAGSSDNRLSLTQMEDIKRSAQNTARAEYGKVGGNSMLGEAKMDIAGKLRSATEKEIEAAAQVAGPNSKVAELAQDFVPVKQETGDYIALSNAAAKGAAQASQRAAVGPVASIGGLAALTSGHPAGLLGAVGYHLAKKYGASATARGARFASQGVNKLAETVTRNPAALGRFGGVLARSLNPATGGSNDKFATTNFLLSKNPDYQQTVQGIHNSDSKGDGE